MQYFNVVCNLKIPHNAGFVGHFKRGNNAKRPTSMLLTMCEQSLTLKNIDLQYYSISNYYTSTTIEVKELPSEMLYIHRLRLHST